MFGSLRWISGHHVAIPLLGAVLAFSTPTSITDFGRVDTRAVARSTVVIVGTIRDAATNAPIQSANILVGGSAQATATKADGRYVLPIANATRGTTIHLQVRRLGYQALSLSVKLSADTVRADASLTAAPMMLDQVTVATATPAVESRKVSFAVASPAPQQLLLRGSVAGASVSKFAREKREGDTWAPKGRSLDARADSSVPGGNEFNREQYDRIEDNPFLAVNGNPRSTFSIDVDRASYGNVRRFLTGGTKPPADAVRIEELVNYFPYSLDEPRGKDPIAITAEVAQAPWQARHQLVRIALQARRINADLLPPNNLVFLIDVSGSMQSPDKLPLVKESLRLLVNQLREQDRVALVVYAGSAGLVLPSTPGSEKASIAEAIDRLEAGGSTAGGAGIELAYRTAKANFMREGNNRVILATDGDFNVGASSDAEMERLIESKRSEGTYLTVLGFGQGNIQDAKMEKLAKKGNGNYAYVDNIEEARKTLVREMGATLVTVANDVKLQVEFNPAAVRAYRLIGYEDRLLRDEDFTDDRKDAGDIGSGHTVTALYEVVPVGVTGTVKVRGTDSLRYTTTASPASDKAGNELLFVKLRYKQPGDSTSKLMSKAVTASRAGSRTSDDFRFAASVASFGMLLRNSEYKGTATGADVLSMARGALGDDAGKNRAEFVRLVERWQQIVRPVAERE